MAQYNILNVKLCNSQLYKIKSTKYEIGITLKLSSNMFGTSNDEANFSHRLLLIYRKVPTLCKTFANNQSANINLSKFKLSTKYTIRWIS